MKSFLSEQEALEFKGLASLFGGDNPNCIRCGLCLPFCPTYRETGLEGASPRGRIALMKALLKGDLDPSDIREQLYLCLDCRACETACPSGVRFGSLLERARIETERDRKRSPAAKLVRIALFQWLLPHQKNVNLLADLLHFYQASGLQHLTRRSGLRRLLPPRLRNMEELLPPVPSRKERRPLPEKLPASSPTRDKVAFFTGCVMGALYPHINRDTAELLMAAGCDVVVPEDQCCCGALHLHSGEEAVALTLAKRNIDAFERAEANKVIVNSAGCGALLKGYQSLLKDDPIYAPRAMAFSQSVMDISEYLTVSGTNGRLNRLDMTVVYHEPCHLLHAQGVSSQPKKILISIPGVNIIPLPEADRCCGGAGVYNITHMDLSMSILGRKMSFIVAARPDAIITGNPGCLIQLAYGARRLKLNIPILHTVQLLRMALADGPNSYT